MASPSATTTTTAGPTFSSPASAASSSTATTATAPSPTSPNKPALPSDTLWATGATFGDYDGDGFADLFVSHYVDFNLKDLAGFGSSATCKYHGHRRAVRPARVQRLARHACITTTATAPSPTSPKPPASATLLRAFGLTAVWSHFDDDNTPRPLGRQRRRPQLSLPQRWRGPFQGDRFRGGRGRESRRRRASQHGRRPRRLSEYRPHLRRHHAFQRRVHRAVSQRRQNEFHRRLVRSRNRSTHHSLCRLGRCLLRFR